MTMIGESTVSSYFEDNLDYDCNSTIKDGGGIADAFSNVGVVDRDIRQDIYLDFLDVNDQARRMRDGVYSSTVLGHGSKTVKIIILDTRYSRGDFVIPSVASFRFMGGFAVASRLLSTIMGLVRFQTETILGDTQWLWLESELNSTKNISITILVSSIQVFTSNPIVESFGHFPLARRKLVNLLMAYKPRGLLVLSGDVHLAEVLSAGPELQPIEFTSSGLTHDCSDGGIPKFVGEFIWYLFGKHRNGINPMYSNKNFGGIDIHWKENNDSDCSFERINVTIFDDTGQPVYSVIRSTCSMDDILPQRISSFSAGPWYFETAWQQCILFGCIFVLLVRILIARQIKTKVE